MKTTVAGIFGTFAIILALASTQGKGLDCVGAGISAAGLAIATAIILATEKKD